MDASSSSFAQGGQRGRQDPRTRRPDCFEHVMQVRSVR